MTQPTEAQTNIVERLLDEADLCQNEGAEDIATLLSEAAAEITRLRTELAEAHTRGVKAGLDAAARVADGEADAADLTWKEFCDPHDQGRWFGADQVATAIRAIDPASVEVDHG